MKVDQFFETHPVFHYNEFADFMTALGTKRPSSWGQQLAYHQKVGHLIRIRKYLYAVKPKFKSTIWVNPYIVASKVVTGSVIAYHTALELHGVAYTTFNEFYFIVNRNIKPFSYDGNQFRAIFKPAITMMSLAAKYGIATMQRDGIVITITSLECTIVDVLAKPHLGGGWEEIWRSLDNIIKFDVNKVIEYALYLDNATTTAKVGFFLDCRPAHLAIDAQYVQKLLPYIPTKPHYMDRSKRSGAKYISKWQLMVPQAIIDRSWEESNVNDI